MENRKPSSSQGEGDKVEVTQKFLFLFYSPTEVQIRTGCRIDSYCLQNYKKTWLRFFKTSFQNVVNCKLFDLKGKDEYEAYTRSLSKLMLHPNYSLHPLFLHLSVRRI